jgi:hypothetical protein
MWFNTKQCQFFFVNFNQPKISIFRRACAQHEALLAAKQGYLEALRLPASAQF